MRISILAASFAALVPALAAAATVTVSPNGPLTTIQQGVAAAVAGDKVLIKAGLYSGPVNIPAGKTGLRIQGAGNVVLDVVGPGATNFGSGFTVGAADVTIKGLTIRNPRRDKQDNSSLGDGIRVQAAGAHIENCTILNTDSDGISIEAGGARIKKCAFAATDGVAVFIDDVADTRITSCSFRQANNNAIFTSGVCAGIVIEACSFEQVEDNTAIDIAVSSPGAVVTNCRFRHCSFEAIGVSGFPIEITNNKVEDCGGGFILSDSSGLVENNVLRRLRDTEPAIGVFGDVSALDITDNVIQDCLAQGILIDTDSGSCSVRDAKVARCGSRSLAVIDVRGTGHTLANIRVNNSFCDAFAIDGSNHTLTGCIVTDAIRDGFDVGSQATGIAFQQCRAERCLAEGFDNSGGATSFVNCVAKKNRIDVANNGSFIAFDVTFATGGLVTLPEID